MSFLLDTNIVSAHLKKPTDLAHRFIQHMGRLAAPTVVLAELHAGACGPSHPPRARLRARAYRIVCVAGDVGWDVTPSKSAGARPSLPHCP